MRYTMLTAIAVSLSASLSYAQDAPPTRACGQFEDYRIWLLGAEDLGEETATAECGVPRDAGNLVAGCTRVIERASDGGILSDAHFNRALGRLVLGDLDGAIADLDLLLSSDTDSDAYDMRGLAYFCRGDLDRAIADFNAALEAWDENELALSDRARVHFERGDLEEAWKDAMAAYEIEPENATAVVLMGAIAELEGDMTEAAYSYDEALEIEFFCDCGEIDYDAVEAAFERVLIAATEAPLSDCRTGQGESAIDACTAYLELDYFLSDNEAAEGYALRGAAHLAASNPDDAIADFDAAISYGSGVDSYLGRGAARALIDDLGGAIGDFTEAFRLEPGNPVAVTERARMYILAGDLSRATADLTVALFLDPNAPLALALRGVVRERQGRLDDAFADFNAALGIDPDLPTAVQGLERLSR